MIVAPLAAVLLAAAPAAPNCGPPIAGVDSLADSPLVILGELHGMTAPPAFAANLACRLLAKGPVVVLLELPKQEQPRLDAFLHSAGTPADRAALIAGEFWTKAMRDGRSSEARVAMLESLRQAFASGAKLRVLAFDDTELHGQDDREKGMAANILAALKPGEKGLVLVGNLHAHTVPGAPWNPKQSWMGQFLREKLPTLVSLDARYLDGQAWVCFNNSCGAKPMKGKGTGEAWSIERTPRDTSGLDGVYQLGRAVVSPPAVPEK